MTLLNGMLTKIHQCKRSVYPLQSNFRQARRSCGMGSLVWDRMQPGKPWDYFIDQLWQYQWTQNVTTLNPEIRTALYEESQGILDIVVKLFMLSQLRAIDIGDVRGVPESLTAKLIQKVAREDFRIVRPMLDALRTNDKKALLRYDDLLPLQLYFEQVTASVLQSDPEPIAPGAAIISSPELSTEQPTEVNSILLALQSLGIPDDVARALIQDAQTKDTSGDPLLLMGTILANLSSGKKVKQRLPKVAKDQAISLPESDLRRMVAEGKERGQSAYESLLTAGAVRAPMSDFAV